MIYFFYGRDREKAKAKSGELVRSFLKRKPNTSIFKINSENFNPNHFDEFIGGQGLFTRNHVVFFDRVFENEDQGKLIISKIKEVAESPNIFIFLEGKVNKTILAKFEKNAAKVQGFSEELEEKEKKNYSFTDAFGARDKKKLWILYQKELAKGKESEEIHGLLFWQLKTMLLAATCTTGSEAGLHPFVFAKAKQYSKNYGEPALKKLSHDLITIYHHAHRGTYDFPNALEKFILTF